MLTKYIDSRDLFGMSNYRVYGSNYPLVCYRNGSAPNAFRALVIGDSFSIPVKAFMSTAFTEVDSIDPRYYTASSIRRYVTWTKPDLVILIRYIPTEENLWGNGKDPRPAASGEREEIFSADRFEIRVSDSGRNTKKVDVTLEPGKTYHVAFDQVTVTEGDAGCISAVLYEKNRKKVIWSSIMDIAYCREHGGFSWDFTVPEEEKQYELRLCPGAYEQAGGTGMTCTGLKVLAETGKE